MENCVFCQIVAGKNPCYKVYEDGQFLGFLDINPRTVGHSLLIPKNHYRFVYDVPNFERYWVAALSLTKAIKKALRPSFITYLTHGLEVPHAHIHILPRQDETELVPVVKNIPTEEMKKTAEKILQATRLQPPRL